jgi:hypothetical protein
MTKHPAPPADKLLTDEETAAQLPQTIELSPAEVIGLGEVAEQSAVKPKRPARVERAINNIVERRQVVLVIRDRANDELKGLDAALLALGWDGE